jgi:hypothetical protein
MGEEVDISLRPYDEWVAFVFGHPVPNPPTPGGGWYWDFSFEVSDPARLVAHFTRLCNKFLKLTEHYTLPQVDQGIWCLLGARTEFGQYLRDEQVPAELRKSCVRSMYRVFADFVSKSDVKEMETCFWMWWDILLDGFYIIGDNGHFDDDAREIEEAILETLSEVLQLDDRRTQKYALHGLGHLRHPKAREVVAEYIEMYGGKWAEEEWEWLESCRTGAVM